jgi:hypothetical protein
MGSVCKILTKFRPFRTLHSAHSLAHYSFAKTKTPHPPSICLNHIPHSGFPQGLHQRHLSGSTPPLPPRTPRLNQSLVTANKHTSVLHHRQSVSVSTSNPTLNLLPPIFYQLPSPRPLFTLHHAPRPKGAQRVSAANQSILNA